MSAFRPLTLARIEEGQLARDLDETTEKVHRALVAFVREHGGRAGKNVKASVTLKIEFTCANPDEGEVYDVKATLKESVPSRPVRKTAAFPAVDGNSYALFCRASGTTQDNPRQTVAFTEAGEVVNPETGEVTHAADQ